MAEATPREGAARQPEQNHILAAGDNPGHIPVIDSIEQA